MNKNIINKAVKILRAGGVIAYPTEAVFGLGCDPFNVIAVKKILYLKHRSEEKGLILIASKWEQVKNLIAKVSPKVLAKTFKTSEVTWVFPAIKAVPNWLTGEHSSIAIRITKHPIAKALCDAFDSPIVSTSANIEGAFPAKTVTEVKKYFPKGIDLIVGGQVGGLKQPTVIRDALTDEVLRG